jgi:hypothetical protein
MLRRRVTSPNANSPRIATLFLCTIAMLVIAGTGRSADLTPEVATVSASASELRLAIDMPAGSEPWQGLVAVPRGASAHLLETAEGIELGEPAIMHGVRIVPVSVSNPGGGATTRELAVGFDAAGGSLDARTQIAETFANLIASEFIGGERVLEDYEIVPGGYLMICSSALGVTGAVGPLAEWRRRQGYDVRVVTTAQTGTTTGQIKSYIQNVYDTAEVPLAYVSLVGDANGTVAVATWHENMSGYHGEGDHEYTRLEGDDILSDVHIGRLTARSVTELTGIVNKILDYEQTPDTLNDPGWFTRALLVGDPSSSGTSTIYVNQWLKEQLLELDYTQIDTLWSGPFANQIFQRLNVGASVYSYRGYLGCSGFNTGYIDNLTNGSELPFAVMPTCASGSFENTHTYTEAMLRNPNGGAIGAVGTATIGTHTRYNNCYFHGVWEGVLNESDRHLGYAHTRGKLELYRQYQQFEPDIVAIWSTWNNLMGDPATAMRQAMPDVPTVTYPSVLPPDAGAVPVTVTIGGQPRAAARVTAWRDGEVQVSGRTNASGEVVLALPTGLPAGDLAMTVTGDDLFPHRGELSVGSVDAYCATVGWSWNDGADLLPDAGETGELSLQVRNLGETIATDVRVAVDPVDDAVLVDGGVVIVGDLDPGETVTVASWTVTMPAELSDGSDLHLRTNARSGSDEPWTTLVTLPVSAPAFTVIATDWNGTAGQTGTLSLTVRNDGSEAALGLLAGFSSASNFLLPTGPVTVDLGNVAPGVVKTVEYQLAVAAEAWGGHLASCSLTMTTATGSRQDIAVTLPVGDVTDDSPVGPGTMGYLAWDDGDPVPDAPVYAWREIDPNHGGSGASVGLGDFSYEQDDTEILDLPFTFRYRGRDFDRISICSNGWVSLGATYLVHWRNWALPAAGSPDVMLAVFWDDLAQSGTNRVYHHHDAEDGVYVVQWSRMRNRFNGLQNCQVVLYDPAVHETTTGDGLIVFQYDQVTNNDSSRGYATVGIQDGTDGLTYTYYNQYAGGGRTLQSGRAIAFVPTPVAAPAGIAVDPGALEVLLAVGQATERTVEIRNTGAAGSTLYWQMSAHNSDVGKSVAADASLDRERTVTMVSPNGGEYWTIGESRSVLWTADPEVSRVRLQIDRGEGWEPLAADLEANLGSWTWTVAGPSSATCRMRVVDQGDVLVSDVSDGEFSIEAGIPWLALGQVAGQIAAGESETVTVSFDAAGLEPGQYEADLAIISSGSAPVIVPVILTIDTSTDAIELPRTVSLAPAAPNPFNPRTSLSFTLPQTGTARLTIHDMRGRLVRTLVDGVLPAGVHEVQFDGRDDRGRGLASGSYLGRLVVGSTTHSTPLTLVK